MSSHTLMTKNSKSYNKIKKWNSYPLLTPYVQNVIVAKHITNKGRQEVQIRRLRFFIRVLNVNISGIKIEEENGTINKRNLNLVDRIIIRIFFTKNNKKRINKKKAFLTINHLSRLIFCHKLNTFISLFIFNSDKHF